MRAVVRCAFIHAARGKTGGVEGADSGLVCRNESWHRAIANCGRALVEGKGDPKSGAAVAGEAISDLIRLGRLTPDA